MDSIFLIYLEETEDMLQKAEELLIQLEAEYSPVNINELFRIAHTIKGSSNMVGFEDIGNLMHKLEDMLDCARSGSIQFEQSIVSLCFDGVDIVKKMLQYKKQPDIAQDEESLIDTSFSFIQTVEAFIHSNKKEKEKPFVKQQGNGVVSSLLNKASSGENKYYISFCIEDDAPMKSPVLMMILKSVENVGSLVYSSITDESFSDPRSCEDIKICDFILYSDFDKAELYTYFNISYIEKINIVDISKKIINENDIPYTQSNYAVFDAFFEGHFKLSHLFLNKIIEVNKTQIKQLEEWHDKINKSLEENWTNKAINGFVKEFNNIYDFVMSYQKRDSKIKGISETFVRIQYVTLMEKGYHYIRGNKIFRVYRPRENGFVSSFKSFVAMVDKPFTKILFIDMSNISIVDEREIKQIIDIKKQLADRSIQLIVIAAGPYARRIVNIFDSIRPIERFSVFSTEFDVLAGKCIL